ncbi:DUF3160 domain-containing protein [candidate division KSB1 bacterium]|nr:DUF3160 domain-containing protein [candidate division KSB1 bacterium]
MKTKHLKSMKAALVILAFFVGAPAQGQMIAEITGDIQTEFGLYQPMLITVVPDAEPYQIAPDFSNIQNFNDFRFSDSEKQLLLQNHFIVNARRDTLGTGYKEIYDIYNECREYNIPIFVTTDALLHTFHLIYDYVLKTVECKKFIADLNALTAALLQTAEAQYEAATDSSVKAAASRNVAYLCIAASLLEQPIQIPPYAESLANKELSLISNAAGYAPSPLLGYDEDYTQYKPRGHYTASDSLKAYFKAMMWLGRATFTLNQASTRSALLLVQAMNNTTVSGEPAIDVWQRIYAPTVFFVGKSDDINVYAYNPLATEIYSAQFNNLLPDAFADTSLISAFIDHANQLPDPQIPTFTPKGFRLMGQRFIPDAYMMSRVVAIFAPREMPRGLDVMTVLGSARAKQILGDYYNDTAHFPQLDSLCVKFESLPDSVWVQNLYWNWLYCLMPLLVPKEAGYPEFMRSPAWIDKDLYAALASWAELRHDTILYAKSSVTLGMHPTASLVQGYVEPNPHFFARMAALVSFMRTGLSSASLLFSEFDWRLQQLEELLLSLLIISEKELSNQNLTSQEYQLICNFGKTIEELVTTSSYGLEGPMPRSEDEMPVIADVHTDPVFTNSILEEGVGYPFNIYVICNVAGQLVVTRGGGFSYYEFTRPIAEGRLNDEEWKAMLKSDSPPALPIWTSNFFDASSPLGNKQPEYYYWRTMGMLDLCVTVSCDSPVVGDIVEMEITSNHIFANSPTIDIMPETGDAFSIENVKPSDSGYRASFDTQSLSTGRLLVQISAQLGRWELYGKVSYRYLLHLERTSAAGENVEITGQHFTFMRNYPNPFNASTDILYELSQPGHVTLEIYNLLGHKLRTLVSSEKPAGRHTIRWDGMDTLGCQAPTGIYMCRLKHAGGDAFRKIMLVR